MGILYVFGGHDGFETLGDFWSFDLSTSWLLLLFFSLSFRGVEGERELLKGTERKKDFTTANHTADFLFLPPIYPYFTRIRKRMTDLKGKMSYF